VVKALALAAILAFEWQLPPGFPLPHVTPDNRMSAARFELGRRLFYDPRLSADGTQSCATCHQQSRAFTDGRTHARNTMTLTNVAYNTSFTWRDPNLRSLEQHVLVPMFNELGFRKHERAILDRLRGEDALFRAAFPGERKPIHVGNIARALATFERALISGRSPYDKAVYDGEHAAMSDAAWRGMRLFTVHCSECHAGFNLSGPVRYVGNGTAKPARIRVPTLRNVALTGPYLQDGSLTTLAGAIDRYKKGFSANEKRDLVAFLEALTDREFVTDPRFASPSRQ
jgi:cytochrome c peroxidase